MQRVWSTYLARLSFASSSGHTGVQASSATARPSVSDRRLIRLLTALTTFALFTSQDGRNFVREALLDVNSRIFPNPYMSSPSRRLSIDSTAHSAYSVTTSQLHMLPQGNSKLVPPNLPFASNVSLATGSLRTGSPYLGAQSSLSLSVNYLPTKFSDAVLYNGLKNRGKAFPVGPKRGGGREAFRSGEARMPGDGDEDYDGIQGGFFTKEGGRTKPRLRWNGFKWTLFFSNFLVSTLSLFCDPFYVFLANCSCGHMLISFFGSIYSFLGIPSLASYSCSALGLTSGNMPTLSE